jgi:PleD family two-component response regulator
VREADAALYQAERDGRDRVMSAPRAIAVRKRFAA